MQCQETGVSGSQCSREAQEGRDYCWQHPIGSGPTSIPTEEIIRAVRKYKGGIYLAAEDLDISHQQIRDRAQQNDNLEDLIAREKGMIDDRAELGLVKAIQDGEAWAIKFRLKHAADRGYKKTERKEVTGADGGSLEVVFDDTIVESDES